MTIFGEDIITVDELQKISTLPENKKLEKIEELLASSNVNTRIKATGLVKFISEDKRMNFLEKGLNDKSIDVRVNSIYMFKYIPQKQIKFDLISKYLRLNDNGANHWGLLEATINAIQYLPSEQISTLIHKAQGCPVFFVPVDTMKIVKFVPPNEQLPFIKKGLNSKDFPVKLEALKTLPYMSPEDRLKIGQLIFETLEHIFPPYYLPTEPNCKSIIDCIEYVFVDKRSEIIKKAYKHFYFLESNSLIKELRKTIELVLPSEQEELKHTLVEREFESIND